MVTAGLIEVLRLGIKPIDDRLCLLVESGLLWVLKNTTLKFQIDSVKDLERLPANVKLFIVKYVEIMRLRSGITSESISNLSQSFDTTDKNALLWEAAEELLSDVLKSRATFVSARNRWK